MADRTPGRVFTTLGVASATVVVSFTPLYHVVWWWDLLAHGLGGVTITLLSRWVRREWWVSLFCVLCAGVAWEWFEFAVTHPVLIPPTLPDTLSDLAAEVVAWGAYRAGSTLSRPSSDRSPAQRVSTDN